MVSSDGVVSFPDTFVWTCEMSLDGLYEEIMLWDIARKKRGSKFICLTSSVSFFPLVKVPPLPSCTSVLHHPIFLGVSWDPNPMPHTVPFYLYTEVVRGTRILKVGLVGLGLRIGQPKGSAQYSWTRCWWSHIWEVISPEGC